ncbi:MAG TPA: hypothetical protein VN023_07675 [Methylovorus sp.]|nr:hypothetical protein [Methylovorus sp.]
MVVIRFFVDYVNHVYYPMMYTKYIHFTLALLLLGCYERIDSPEQLRVVSAITSQAPGPIDFKNLADKQWSLVCFFGPYASKSSDVLGFNWELENKIEVMGDESINVIVFATEKNVTKFVVIPREKADFAEMSRQCFPRNDAVFIYDNVKSSYFHKNASFRADDSTKNLH